MIALTVPTASATVAGMISQAIALNSEYHAIASEPRELRQLCGTTCSE